MWKFNVIHAQLRMNCDLNAHLYNLHVIDNPASACLCSHNIDDTAQRISLQYVVSRFTEFKLKRCYLKTEILIIWSILQLNLMCMNT